MADHLQAEEKSDLGGKLVWFVAGATVGAAVALLLAPQTGKETRKAITRTATCLIAASDWYRTRPTCSSEAASWCMADATRNVTRIVTQQEAGPGCGPRAWPGSGGAVRFL